MQAEGRSVLRWGRAAATIQGRCPAVCEKMNVSLSIAFPETETWQPFSCCVILQVAGIVSWKSQENFDSCCLVAQREIVGQELRVKKSRIVFSLWLLTNHPAFVICAGKLDVTLSFSSFQGISSCRKYHIDRSLELTSMASAAKWRCEMTWADGGECSSTVIPAMTAWQLELVSNSVLARYICFLCKRKFTSAALLTKHKWVSQICDWRESILVHGSWRGGVSVWRGKRWSKPEFGCDQREVSFLVWVWVTNMCGVP